MSRLGTGLLMKRTSYRLIPFLIRVSLLIAPQSRGSFGPYIRLANLMKAREHLVDGTTRAVGLPLFCDMISRERSAEELRQMLEDNMVLPEWRTDALFDFGPGDSQEVRRCLDPNWRDQKEKNGDALPFCGDGEPDAPPFAWTELWGGQYSSLYGPVIPFSLWRWGYVFWDADRLQKSGVTIIDDGFRLENGMTPKEMLGHGIGRDDEEETP